MGCYKGDFHLEFCHVRCTVFARLSSGMPYMRLSSGMLSFGMYSIAGLSFRMLNRGWSSGMFSYGMYSMYRVVF